MSEFWKDIEGYEGLYQVSDLGKVRSVDRVVLRVRDGKSFPMKQKSVVLKHALYSNGYAFVALSKEGVVRQFLIHRLVAKAFLPNPDSLPEVNHKKGNKLDNRASELEWMTSKANREHAYEHGLIDARGANNGYARKTVIEKDSIKKEFPTQRSAAAFIGVKEVSIYAAKKHKFKLKGYKIS